MRLIRNILGRLFACWALVTFAATLLLFLIPFLCFCYFKPEPEKTIRFGKFSCVWMDVFFFLVGCSLRVKGRENFVPHETYIVICNHNSFFDILIASPRIPGGNKTIAKIELARIPVFNLVYNSGTVLVDRKSDRSRADSFVRMKEVLAMGLHMCIYPEGTRNRTREPLKSFHNGAFRLAADTGKSIIPAIIFNTNKALPINKTFFVWPTRMEIHFLPAVPVQTQDSAENLKQKLFTIMSKYYVDNAR